ncbi:hypothetical protein [Litoribacter populi]|uniref:hypothetical protein n=1 Tax=Litoribacter populi TaxID=2598460 RepID=UPI00117F0848|nr:hypothetical protein [Litoribacter populi]
MKIRLIVHIDFSLNTELLLNHAFIWANAMGARLLLVHQVQLLLPSLTDIQTRSEILRNEKKMAEEKINYLLNRLPQSQYFPIGIKVFKHSLLLKTQKLIAEGDILFMLYPNKIGLNFLHDNGFEFNAAKVLPIPIIILPQEYNLSLPLKFFIGVKNINTLNIRALNLILNKLNYLNIKLIFFTIIDSDVKNDKTDLKPLTKSYAENFEVYDHSFVDKNANVLMRSLITPKGGEILLVQKENKSCIGHLFNKSTINTLLRERKTPMIILPEI